MGNWLSDKAYASSLAIGAKLDYDKPAARQDKDE
jgi:hypothetical protein